MPSELSGSGVDRMRLLGLLPVVGPALGLTRFVTDEIDSPSRATAEAAGVTALPGGVVVPATGGAETSGGAAASGGNALDAARTVAGATESQALRTVGRPGCR